MKVEKTKSRTYNGKPYFKYRIVIPEKLMTEARFKEGEILEAEAKNGEIKIKKK